MAKQLIREAETTAPAVIAKRLRNAGVEPRYQLVRRTSSGATQEMPIESSGQIEPGDVVEVRTTPSEDLESGIRMQTGRAELQAPR